MAVEPRVEGGRAAFGRPNHKKIHPLQRPLTHALFRCAKLRKTVQTDSPNRL